MNDRKLLTGLEWSKLYSFEYIDYKGWFDKSDFEKEPITYFEFLNRSSQCKLNHPENTTRRDASKFKEKLNQINGQIKTSNTKT